MSPETKKNLTAFGLTVLAIVVAIPLGTLLADKSKEWMKKG